MGIPEKHCVTACIMQSETSSSDVSPATFKSSNNFPAPKTGLSMPDTSRSSHSNFQNLSCIACIAESRGNASEVGLAIINLEQCICHVYQFLDTPTFQYALKLVSIHGAQMILFSDNSLTDHYKSKLVIHLLQCVPSDLINSVERSIFNYELGSQFMQDYSISTDSLKLSLCMKDRYYAMAALGALSEHVGLSKLFHFQSLLFEVSEIQEFVMIDRTTSKSMELVSSLVGQEQVTLLGRINYTLTKMGFRLLKNNILQPLKEESLIQARQEAIQAITDDFAFHQSIQEVLKNFPDIDQLISTIAKTPKSENAKLPERNVQTVISIYEAIFQTKKVLDCMKNAPDFEIFQIIRQNLSTIELERLENKFLTILSEDCFGKRKAHLSQTTRCYAVKDGHDVLLDVARKTLKETTEDIYEYVECLSKSLNFSPKLKYSPERCFYLTIPNSKEALPDCFLIQSQSKDSLYCSTLELLKLNQRLKESLEEIFLISDKALNELLVECRQAIAMFYKMSESIGLLDFIFSAAEYARNNQSCIPSFGKSIAIKNGRNPILSSATCVPNDFFLGDGHEFSIISGINMSGKTTYIKTLVYLVIMAQIGYPIPCDYASITIRNDIFTRLGSDDDLESNCSSFLAELRDIVHVFHRADSKSLLIIDELGRGTAVSDGLAIATAISEVLIRQKVYVMFVTHFERMIKYLATIPSVNLVNLKATQQDGIFRCLYHAEEGFCTESDYGIKLAQAIGLPAELTAEALQIKVKLDTSKLESKENQASMLKMVRKRRLVHETAAKLKAVRGEQAAVEAIKSEFYLQLEQIS